MINDTERDQGIRHAIKTVIELEPDEITEVLFGIDWILKQDEKLTGRKYKTTERKTNNDLC